MIHPTALVDPAAQIDPTVTIGAYALIEGPVKLAANVVIGAHAHIIGNTTIGQGTTIGRAAIIGEAPQDLSFDPAIQSFTIIGENNVIREQSTIHRGSKPGSATRVGSHNFIMANAHFAHDVQVGDRNIVANAALLAGHVHLGNNTFIGGGAVFHQFIRVGDSCVIQGNSSISQDVPHFCSANRLNRITGLNVIGLRRQGYDTQARAQIKEVFDLWFTSGKNHSQALATARQREWPEHCERLLRFFEAPSKLGICSMRAGRR
ncbi:MAG: acyl-ACP--UDP-N-acetylglucosamine O-acyltransferase [Verrucomicrobiaceae bacterium]|nr:acyl-ACP--UDP-N-acetylglucosamine O-acyltransferase [Verrucomicrobiaceae bacterium]